MILRLLPAVAFGVFIGGLIGAIVTGDYLYTIAWAIAIPVTLLSFFAIGFQRMTVRAAMAAPADIRIFALARVENVRRTGKDFNGVPEVDLRVTVAPDDRDPYRTTIRQFVDLTTLGTLQAGRIVVVQRVRADRAKALLAVQAPDEWKAKAAAATRDRSFPAAIAPDWEDDDAVDEDAPVTAGAPRPRRRMLPVLPILVILAAAAVTLIPAYPVLGRTVTNIATGNWDGNSMLTGDHQQEAVDAIAAVAGHYDFTGVYFYEDYVIVEGLTTPGADTTDDYHYRYGRAFREGPSLIQPDLDVELFDAADIDFSQIARLVEQAKEDSGLDEIESVYANVTVYTPEELVAIHVSVDNAYDDAFFIYGLDGEEIVRNGSAFE